MIKYSSLIVIFAVVIVGWIYFPWFQHNLISGGDSVYYHPEMLRDFSPGRTLWTSTEAYPAGINPNFPFYWYTNVVFGIFVNMLGISWNLVYKFFFFFLFLFLGIYSIKYFCRKLIAFETWQWTVATVIYLTNSYILLVVAGGQSGVALAYALAPLVFTRIVSCQVDYHKFRAWVGPVIVSAFIIALQLMFDIRISYLALVASSLFLLLQFLFKPFYARKVLVTLVMVGLMVLGIHAFWIMPFIKYNLVTLPSVVTNQTSLNFFNFATFENAFGLFHPNWPDNIFGKISFMKWEYLLVPLFAFSHLLFPLKKLALKADNKLLFVLFFSALSLLGIFLSKGINEPLGFLYKYSFLTIPGFNLFRDSTKFYIFIALSFSTLVPWSIPKIGDILEKKFSIQNGTLLISILFLVYWSLTVFPALNHNLPGTFRPHEVPEYYEELAHFLDSQDEFFRTLWVPTQSRYRYHSEKHPLLTMHALSSFDDEEIQSYLKDPTLKDVLSHLSVKYIIVPVDSEEEIFLTDRKYNESIRQDYITVLNSLSFLKKTSMKEVEIYENSTYMRLFSNSENNITWKKISPAEYMVSVNGNSGTIYFSEIYSPHWVVKADDKIIAVSQTEENLMLFTLPDNSRNVRVFFKPEYMYRYSSLFSIGFVSILVLLPLVIRHKYGRVKNS